VSQVGPGQSPVYLNPSQYSRGFYVPAGWGGFFKAAARKATARTGLCRIAVQGDSLAQGNYCANPPLQSWPNVLQAQLASAYGLGDDGSGFFSATYCNGALTALGMPGSAITYYAGVISN